jgi:hypothetical protein
VLALIGFYHQYGIRPSAIARAADHHRSAAPHQPDRSGARVTRLEVRKSRGWLQVVHSPDLFPGVVMGKSTAHGVGIQDSRSPLAQDVAAFQDARLCLRSRAWPTPFLERRLRERLKELDPRDGASARNGRGARRGMTAAWWISGISGRRRGGGLVLPDGQDCVVCWHDNS